MKKIILKIKNNLPTFIIGTLGVLARFIAMVMADPIVFQHDVAGEFGHLDYAVHIFRNWSLANHNFYEFSQPPVNAFLQAVVMKICSPFIRYSKINHTKLYSVTIILTFIFSCITLFIIYKILKEFDLSIFATNFVFGIMAFYPAILILSAEYNNDTISYMFFYLSLYLSIVWAKTKKLSTIILLALSIGIGMLTKVSVGIIAFITGPMMIAVLIKSKDKKKILIQLLIFALIVFPLGLSYSIRNLILFKQPIGSIFEIAEGTLLDIRLHEWTIKDRFLSFPVGRLFDKESGIFHNLYEYNVWIDLIKTSTFDEVKVEDVMLKNILTVVYILNIIFYIVGIVCVFITFIDIIKYVVNKISNKKNTTFPSMSTNNINNIYNINNISNNKCISKTKNIDNTNDVDIVDSKIKLHLNFKIICVMLFTLAIVSYISFNVKYPYSCNSNYRYISYITFAMAGCIASRDFFV